MEGQSRSTVSMRVIIRPQDQQSLSWLLATNSTRKQKHNKFPRRYNVNIRELCVKDPTGDTVNKILLGRALCSTFKAFGIEDFDMVTQVHILRSYENGSFGVLPFDRSAQKRMRRYAMTETRDKRLLRDIVFWTIIGVDTTNRKRAIVSKGLTSDVSPLIISYGAGR